MSTSTWVTRITINACRAHRRKRLVRLTFLRRWMTQVPQSDLSPSAATDGERDETNRRVRQAVGGLPNRYREVVVLRYLQGLDMAATAAALGISRGAAEVRLHRARDMLKGELGPLMDDGR
jgi:RNA polymerase sigma-70 factor (ECF subfamily)